MKSSFLPESKSELTAAPNMLLKVLLGLFMAHYMCCSVAGNVAVLSLFFIAYCFFIKSEMSSSQPDLT